MRWGRIKIMKIFIPILLLVFCFSVSAQDRPLIMGLGPLGLNQATFDDAMSILGEPIKDKKNQTFTPLAYSEWFDVPKDLRRVTFKDNNGDCDDTLYFRNGKLIVVERDMKKKLSAEELVDIYDARFYPLIGNFLAGIAPKDLIEGEMKVYYPETFPLEYYMAAANPIAIGLARVVVEDSATAPSDQKVGDSNALPGFVRKEQFISRLLEVQNERNQ